MNKKPIPETRGRKPAIDWTRLPVGTGHPATSGTAHYQNRMAAGKRHYVYRNINGVGTVYRSK
jgi:hypothetical protein